MDALAFRTLKTNESNSDDFVGNAPTVTRAATVFWQWAAA